MPTPHFRHLAAKTFGISILCHLAFLSLFAFTFCEHFISTKPAVVFLGSILPKGELQVFSPSKQVSRVPLIKSTAAHLPQNNQRPYTRLPTTKPPFDQTAAFQSKIPFKPILLQPAKEQPKEKSPEAKPADFAIPERQPLKLQLP